MKAEDVGAPRSAEYNAMMLTLGSGMFLMASAINLVTMFLAFEMVSLTSYILTGHLTDEKRSSEAALKYVIYSAASAGIFLFGMSWLFGVTGTLYLPNIAHSLIAGGTPLAVGVAVILILVGLGYKIASVPFHFWAPDAYTGAPAPVAGLLSVGPKAAGMALLTRFLYEGLSVGAGGEWIGLHQVNWPAVIAILAAASMTVGNLSAIWQGNIKRLLAYSSIAHAGYILMGVAMLSSAGLKAVMFYLAIYVFMNFGAFLVVIALAGHINSDKLEAYAGLGRRAPFLAVAMAVFLVSLAGLPPTSGFIGKLYLFLAVWHKEVYWLAVVAALNTVVALYFYARILREMFLREPPSGAESIAVRPLYLVLLGAMVAPTLVLGLYWSPLMDIVGGSLRFLGGN
jgi:NADH-quinone oxidoreductase subunit N